MKKFVFLLLVPFLVSAYHIQAQNKVQNASSGDTLTTLNSCRGPGFTDKNKDGVCDNASNRNEWKPGPGFTDENNDGVCDHRQNRKGNDKNLNKKGNRNNCPGRGPCRGNGFRHRHGWKWQN